MSARMGNSLQEQTEKTHKNLSDLAARLAVIDAANAKIGELTGQVTQLHNILANKTDRGAFGEVQLENLVRNVLPPNAYEFQVQLSNGAPGRLSVKTAQPCRAISSLMQNFHWKPGIRCKMPKMKMAEKQPASSWVWMC